MQPRIVLSVVGAAFAAVAVGCGGGTETSRTKVAAGFYPLALIAERVVPDAEVANLTPAGAEPHDLELTARDIEAVDRADLVLYLGSGFQPALERAVSGHEGALDLLEGEELIEGSDEHGGQGEEESEDEHEGESGLDPHVWLDPLRFASMARRVAAAIAAPQAADDVVADLKALDREFRDGLADCERRVIVTSHAAFGYLARAYDLEQVTLTGLSPEAEPSARTIETLVDEVKEEGATTVFFETLVSPKLAETVAREAGVQTAVLNPLEGLTEDEIDRGADYFSVMRSNLESLRSALGCS